MVYFLINVNADGIVNFRTGTQIFTIAVKTVANQGLGLIISRVALLFGL